MLIQTGTLLTVTFGVAVLILPVIGVWFLWKNTQFVRKANRLAAELDAEGGLPVDELKRTPGGRIDRDSADEVFARRKAETEDAPDDWRSWFRLAVAYHDARDTPRARKAMQRAIALHDGQARTGLSLGGTTSRTTKGPAARADRPLRRCRTQRVPVLVRPRLDARPRPGRRPRGAPGSPRCAWSAAAVGSSPARSRADEEQRLPLHGARQPEPAHRLLHRPHRRRPAPRAPYASRRSPPGAAPCALTHDAHAQQPQRRRR